MDLTAVLQQLSADPAAPLDAAEVALLLAADEYPDLDIAGYLRQIDSLAAAVRPHLRGGLDEQARCLGTFLFDEQGFAGNADHYYDPRNSYLNEVLDRRLGIPITLSVVAIAVGQRAGLLVEGVALPGHFIVQAIDGDDRVLVDPFHGGRLLTRTACERLVRSVTGHSFSLTAAALAAPPLGAIVMRMLNNLKQIYSQAQDTERTIRVIERQRQLAPQDAELRRDLGVTLVQANRFGPAIDHLKAYLETVPEADDSAEVQALLQRVRAEVAKWN